MAAVNIYEAKMQLSRLLRRVRAGEEIVIADRGTPVAKLVPIDRAPVARVLGGDRGRIWIAPDAFDPMSEEELAEWHDGPIVPTDAAPAAKTANAARRRPKKRAK